MKKTVKSRLIAVHGDKVLVLKKIGAPLRYTLPGGVKKKKETAIQTLIREVGEEIELQPLEKQLLPLCTLKRKGKQRSQVKSYFLMEMESAPIGVLERDKFESALWLDWREALPFMDKMDRMAVRCHFKGSDITTKKKNGFKVPPRLAM